MGEQLALGYGILQSEFIESTLAGNRSNLEYPQRWTNAPDPQVLTASAKRFTDWGLISTHGPHGLVLEVPMDDGAPPRLVSPAAETALLHVSVDTPHPLAGVGHPYWGGGLLCPLSWLPESVVRVEDSPVEVNAMNKWENLIADTPTFGGWCSDGDKLVFAQFLPNLMKGLPNFTDLLIFWARSRLASAKELVHIVHKFERKSVECN
jgi:hypothetical protein